MFYNLIINKEFKELNPLITGYENCAANHSFGPAIREYYLIHYVKNGKGIYRCNGTIYPVKAGQAFLIKPNELAFYKADLNDPWEYIWIGFNGTLSKRLESLPYVFDMNGRLFNEILLCRSYINCREEFLAAKLFEIYCELFELKEKPRKDYIRQASDYINSNYTNKISVKSIADMIGIERTYFSKIFKEKMCQSVQDYIIDIRLDKAKKFLESGNNVSEASQLCGYSDVSNFSKMFKKKYGVSPKHFIL